MGKEWDNDKGGKYQWIAWFAEIMSEAYRCLRPGGHALIWSLPRTSHYAAEALEQAGFQTRDCIYHVTEQDSALGQFMASLDETQQDALTRLMDSQDVPSAILALFGQGFPKSTAVDKQIDKLKGMEREVIGSKRSGIGRHGRNDYEVFHGSANELDKQVYITAPASPDAQRFSGVGTNLKPSVECWWLCRKPLEKGLTIAENCLKWGVGGLAIDKCRIPNTGMEHHKTAGSGVIGTQSGIYGKSTETLNSKQVARAEAGENPRYDSNGRWPSHFLLTHDPSCTEVCAANCAVRLLDEQSGESKSIRSSRGGVNNNKVYGTFAESKNYDCGYKDQGGASRFFQQFHPDPFIYCSKASRRDRSSNGTVENTHPTTKNTALISYFCKLICPEGGIILDPFFGSGTLGVSAIQNGFHFIGIEQSLEYCTIAQARINHARTEHEKQKVAPPSLWDGV